jgi:short-subunit dehydrogenase
MGKNFAGIGKAITEALIQAGAHVVAVARNEQQLQALKDTVRIEAKSFVQEFIHGFFSSTKIEFRLSSLM